MSPCQSRWSCVRFSTVAAVGSKLLQRRRAGSWTAPAPTPRASVRVQCRMSQRVQQGRADVAGHGHRLAGALHQLPGQRGDGGLAVGAGDGQHLRAVAAVFLQIRQRLGEQAPARHRSRPRPAACAADPPRATDAGAGRGCGTPRAPAFPPPGQLPGGRCGSGRRACSLRSACSCRAGPRAYRPTCTRAPQRAHQRAMARPEAPRPRMRTSWSRSRFMVIIAASGSTDPPGTAAW
jgi:hypothetical protein